MKKLPLKICTVSFFLLFFVLNGAAQNEKSSVKNFLWTLKLPAEMQRGPMQVGIGGSFYFERETIGAKHYANLYISFSKMNFLGIGIPAYKYNGKAYLANEMNVIDGLGTSGFEQLQITSVKMQIQVLAAQPNAGGSNSFVLVNSAMGSVHHAAEITKDTNMDHLDLMWAGSYLQDLNWTNSSGLEGRISNLEKLKQNKADYKNIIENADNAYSRKNLEEARMLYQKALTILPSENYPKTQLAKIENAFKEKQKNESAKTPEKPLDNSDRTAQPATLGIQQPVIKQPRGQNQAPRQSNAEIAAAQMAEIKRKQEQAKRIETDLVQKAGSLSQSFTHANAASASSQAMQEAGLSDKFFNSVEELNAEYSRQMQIIEEESNNYAASKAASVSSYIDASSGTGTQYDDAINSSMKAIGGLFSQIKAEKEERENKERLRAEREAQLAAIESRRKAAVLGMRTKLFELFPDGKLPLESHHLKQHQVYIFAYLADKDFLLAQENATIALSGVIPIEKLDDGSFPYKPAVASSLKKFGTGKVYISGYYLNAEDAQKMLDAFSNLASKSSLQVNRFSFQQTAKKNAATNSQQQNASAISKQSAERRENEKKGNFWND